MGLLLAAMLLFACLDATSKHLVRSYPVPLVTWARYAVHCLLMFVFLAPSMGRRLIQTRRPLPQIVRALLLVGTTAFGMAALRVMPLAETTAIVFLAPLLVVALAVIILKEPVRPTLWFAVVGGLAGVAMIARPGGDLEFAGVLFALAAAFCYAFYQILTRQLAATERPVTMLFYTALVGALVTSWPLPWFWSGPAPGAREIVLMCSLGIYGGVGHFLLIRAFRLAPASLLSPFLYVQLVWAALLGWFLHGHFPDVVASSGILIIIASGLFVALGHRPIQHGSRRIGAVKIASTPGDRKTPT